ncbi:CopL family metal-binding regulatory protein [Xanthomonas sp.]|uniref:CopL family metal-binding regulatory protein n=1 Tax=Xanthomonas sp. TaxID=29446 RepID=UPI001F132658|nr:CopL family metal-binding regulatory protein [Xanthomonas sp.]
MPWLRTLLRLLLCLSLTVNTVGSAWASVAMAAPAAGAKAAGSPATPAAMAAHADCHDTMAAAHASDRDQQAPAPDHDGAFKHCCGNGCDCLQHAGAPLLAAAAPGVAVAHAALNPHCRHGRGCPAPYRPIRPPIG